MAMKKAGKSSSRSGGKSSRGRSGGNGSASSQTTTDHDEIRQWAESRGAKPSCVLGTGGKGDTGVLRLDFPGYSGEGSLNEVTWDEWFEKFDDQGLALLYQNETAAGKKSNFNKIVSRETADMNRSGGGKSSRGNASRSNGKSSGGGKSSGRGKSSGGSKSSSGGGGSSARSGSSSRSGSSAKSQSSRRSGGKSSSGRGKSAGGSSGGNRRSGGGSASSKTTTDHDEIREWAEARGAKPSCVLGTGGKGDTGLLRLDFPGYSGEGSLNEITWDEWFEKFDDQGLALLYQEETAAGEKSNFNKLVSRETASAGSGRGGSRGRSGRSGGGRSGGKSAGGSKRGGSSAGRTSGARSSRGSTRSSGGRASKSSGRGSKSGQRRGGRNSGSKR